MKEVLFVQPRVHAPHHRGLTMWIAIYATPFKIIPMVILFSSPDTDIGEVGMFIEFGAKRFPSFLRSRQICRAVKPSAFAANDKSIGEHGGT